MGCLPLLMKKKSYGDNKSLLNDGNQSNTFLHYNSNIVKHGDENIVDTEIKVSKLEDLLINSSILVKGSNQDPFEVYDYLKVLGEGTYGKVSKVVHRKNGIIRAMKAIDKKSKIGEISDENTKNLIREINILKSLDHPNIIKIYEYFETEKKLYIVTEFCSGGELFNKIVQIKNFSEKNIAYIMKQIFSAVNFCHLNGVIHRDLKPENVLIETQADSKKEVFIIKIIDFGTSQIYRNKRNTKVKKFTEKIGSSYYIAPEVLNGDYNEKCDLWSCGVIMYMLLCGEPPFDGANDEEIFKNISKAELKFPEHLFKNISLDGKDLIKFLLSKDPNKRYNAQQALDHPWIKGIDSVNFKFSEINSEKLEKITENLRKFQTNQKIQQACLSYIVHNMLKKEEIEEYRKIFLNFDVNSDGRLSREELISGFSLTMSPFEAKIEVDRLIGEIDKDKNNYIEFEEFLSAFMDKEKLLKEEHLSETFMLFDRDGSGKISVNELKQILGGDSKVEENVWNEILLSIDQNCDGEISYKEFRDMMKKMIK